MELQVVEAVVRRLFTDDEFRAWATSDTAAALATYELGSNEYAAVASLCSRLKDEQGAGPTPQLFWF